VSSVANHKEREMAQAKRGNRVKKLLRRSSALAAARAFPSALRGFNFARGWKSLNPEEPGSRAHEGASCGLSSPLKTYFDSVTEGRGIWKWLHYFDVYHRHFQKFVGKEVRVLEVGIYSGGSLEMWKAYFGPKCRIYGVDIETACKAYEDERTRVFIGDQADRRFWKHLREQVPVIDIVIDDGGHLPEQQIVTLEETLPHIRGGGVYLCEDIHNTHNRFAAYVHGLTTALNAVALKDAPEAEGADTIVLSSSLQRSIGSVHHYPFVTVIEKTSSPVRQLSSVRHGTVWQPYL
jgi:hypothetical protein